MQMAGEIFEQQNTIATLRSLLSIAGWQLGGKEPKGIEDLEVALEDIEEGLEAEMEATSAHISALNAEREQAMAGAGDLPRQAEEAWREQAKAIALPLPMARRTSEEPYGTSVCPEHPLCLAP